MLSIYPSLDSLPYYFQSFIQLCTFFGMTTSHSCMQINNLELDSSSNGILVPLLQFQATKME